jgi:hypothetical protein
MGPLPSNHSTVKRSLGSSTNTMSTSEHSRTGHRHPPLRSKSDNSNIQRPPPFQGSNPPRRGRSFSPLRDRGRKQMPPPRSQHRGRTSNPQGKGRGVPVSRSGHTRSKGPPKKRRTHSNRSGGSGRPVMTSSSHSRSGNSVGNRSVHSRNGRTTTYNSRHSRNGDFDRSTHSMSSRSGLSRASIGSHPSLVDQRRRTNRGQKRPFPWSLCCSYFVPILVLIGAAIGLLFATGNNSDASSLPSTGSESLVSNPPVEDPFDGKKSIPQWCWLESDHHECIGRIME